jgi:starvation-inducible DNA-binding protein
LSFKKKDVICASEVIEMKFGTEMPVEIGIKEESRKEIADGLSRLLADTYTLYLKTHNFHWNVTGPLFEVLHLTFEKQYKELAEAVDAIAERIRALGLRAPATYKEFSILTSINEEEGVPSAEEMIHSLVEGHEKVIQIARTVFAIANDANDQATVEFVTGRLRIHEKTAWMLRSSLGNL